MEFLIGRSLANNITNLLLDPVVPAIAERKARLAGAARGGAGRRAGQRRARPARGVLPRLDGDAAAAGHGLRAALRVRHLPAVDPDGWQQEQPDNWLRRPIRGRSPGRTSGRDPLGCSFEVRGGAPACAARAAVQPARRPVRPPGGRLRRQDHQHAAPLGRRAPDYFDFQRVQQRRVRRRAGRDARRRDADARALPGRLHEPGARAALPAGVFPGRLLAGRSRAALPPRATPTGARCPRRSRSSSTTRTRPWPSPS
jgi:hypothetical protein